MLASLTHRNRAPALRITRVLISGRTFYLRHAAPAAKMSPFLIFAANRIERRVWAGHQMPLRAMCDKAADKAKASEPQEPSDRADEGGEARKESEEESINEEGGPLTMEEKLSTLFRLLFAAGIVGVALYFGSYTFRELFPGKMNPNSMFNRAVDECKKNPQLVHLLGEPIKAYGADFGQGDGRRNLVQSHAYATEDGDQRTRIAFNLEGTRTRVGVWAEVSKGMPDGEWVYLITQDLSTGKTMILHDNRTRLHSMHTAETAEGKAAMDTLIGGGRR